jgi:hypothetical protein
MRGLEDATIELPNARERRFLAMKKQPVAFGKRPIAKKGLPLLGREKRHGVRGASSAASAEPPCPSAFSSRSFVTALSSTADRPDSRPPV